MKTDALEYAESPRAALWAGIAIALGLVLHRVFFLVAAIIALTGPVGWLLNNIREADERSTPQLRRA